MLEGMRRFEKGKIPFCEVFRVPVVRQFISSPSRPGLS